MGAVRYALANVQGKRDNRQCATYIREAVEKGGGLTIKRPNPPNASLYGGSLVEAGFVAVTGISSLKTYLRSPQQGDIAVFQPVEGHSAGHIQMYTGVAGGWVSDFPQNGFWPSPRYESNANTTKDEIAVVILRHSGRP